MTTQERQKEINRIETASNRIKAVLNSVIEIEKQLKVIKVEIINQLTAVQCEIDDLSQW